MRYLLKFCLAVLCVWVLGCAMGHAQSAATIYTFPPTYNGSGADPIGLTADSAGNLYGMVVHGGPTTTGITCLPPGCGEIYELVNPGNSFEPWTQKTLYTFAGSDHTCSPEGAPILDAAGNLYGVFTGIGCNGYSPGIFELSPSSSGAWTRQIIYTGEVNPVLAIDSNGNLYASSDYGYAFELLAPFSPGGVWNFKQLAEATNASGGVVYFGGKLYGTAFSSAGYPYGQVFEIARVPDGKGAWAATPIATFAGGTDGEIPPIYPEPEVQVLSLTMPKGDEIFGLTTETLFELKKQSDGSWMKTNLSSYESGDSLAWAPTASANGKQVFAPGGPSGGGATEWSAPKGDATTWTPNTFTFPAASGVVPQGNMVIDDDGLGVFLTSDSAVEHVRGLVPIGAPYRTLDEQGSACIRVSYPASGNAVKLKNTCDWTVDFWYCAQAGTKGTNACTEPGSDLGIYQTGYLDSKKSVSLAVTLGAGQVPGGWAQSCDQGEYPVLYTNKRGVQSLDCGIPIK